MHSGTLGTYRYMDQVIKQALEDAGRDGGNRETL